MLGVCFFCFPRKTNILFIYIYIFIRIYICRIYIYIYASKRVSIRYPRFFLSRDSRNFLSFLMSEMNMSQALFVFGLFCFGAVSNLEIHPIGRIEDSSWESRFQTFSNTQNPCSKAWDHPTVDGSEIPNNHRLDV